MKLRSVIKCCMFYFGMLAFLTLCSACQNKNISTQTNRIFDNEKKVKPFVMGMTDFEALNNKDHPLVATQHAFAFLLKGYHESDRQLLADVKKAIDYMAEEWQPAIRTDTAFQLQYGFDWKSIDEGWWSGMSGFLLPLLYIAAYEVWDDERYLEIARKALHQSLKSPLEGGSLWTTDKGCWISEYSWQGMDFEDEYFVLNGHPIWVVGIKIGV